MFEEIEKQIESCGVVPVVVIENAEDALPLAKALKEGGLPCAEVTFRTDAAKEAIKIMHAYDPNMLVGAGTVLTISQVDEAVEAGAKFIVSPGFDEEVVTYCIQNNIPVFPGCVTPSEVMKAIHLGLDVVKFFPSENYGGMKAIKALAAPFGNIRFMPTGGINENNLEDYLSSKVIIACGGSWMVKKDLIREGNFSEIQKLVEKAKAKVKEIRGS